MTIALRSSNGWSQNFRSRSGSSSSGVNAGTSTGSRRRSVCVRSQAADEHCVLGVSPSASRQEIKAAYRRLALQYHPDVCKNDDCEQRFRQVNDAYQAILLKRDEQGELLDQARSLYDRDEWEEWKEFMGFEGGVPYQWWLGTVSLM